MKTLSGSIVAAAATGLLLFAPARADISVMDNNKAVSIDCAKDGEISLSGNGLTVTAKGVCTKISVNGNEITLTGSAGAVVVSGNHNTVTLDQADEVSVLGNDNTVSVNKPVKRKAPKLANIGSRNKLTAGK